MDNTKKDYWIIRNKSQKAWDDAIKLMNEDNEFKVIKQEYDALSIKLVLMTDRYILEYAIHSNDMKIANFDSWNDGDYRDTMSRCDYFPGEPYVNHDELDFPIPGKTLKILTPDRSLEQFYLISSFTWNKCFSCGWKDHCMPTGFFCEKCMQGKLDTIRNNAKEFDLRKIADMLIARSKEIINNMKNYVKVDVIVENEIKIDCYARGFNEEDENEGQVIIRIVLVSKEISSSNILEEYD